MSDDEFGGDMDDGDFGGDDIDGDDIDEGDMEVNDKKTHHTRVSDQQWQLIQEEAGANVDVLPAGEAGDAAARGSQKRITTPYMTKVTQLLWLSILYQFYGYGVSVRLLFLVESEKWNVRK